jgi:hypothetical protein
MSTNASSSLAATVDTSNSPMDNPVTGGVTHPIVQSNIDTAQLSAVTSPISRFSGTVDRAEEDTDTVKMWKSAVNNIKWVKNTVNPIVKVCILSFFSLRFAELLSALQLEHASIALDLLTNIQEVVSLPCLVGRYGTFTLFYRLVNRLWETGFSMTRTPKSCLRRYEMRLNLQMKRTF